MKMQKNCSGCSNTVGKTGKMRGQRAPVLKMVTSVVLIAVFFSCGKKSRYDSPLTPEESMKTFQFAGNFEAEIFAAEPLVVDPVSMEFDEEGNAYVVGMLDAYKPDSVKGKGKIVLLKDLDLDGRADTSMVFADSIKEASSILPWEGGLLIAAAPNIMYYKDTDGDGRADHKEILFTGFFTGNEEAQITNLRFSVDNWIYANNTGQAGEVTFTRKPEAPKLLTRGADFRFRLDRNEFELTTGPGQFGLAIDDWGHRFFTANSVHIREAVIPRRYIERNPFLSSDLKSATINISDHETRMYQLSATPYWRQERTNRRNKEYQENKLDRVEYARDQFTGASGGTFYGGDTYPQEFYGNIFTGDVAGGLVHRDVLLQTDSLPYMVAQRADAEKSKEFLATTDTWFRPSNFSVGPDGNLYVIDMYRQHIETPLSIPDDLETDMDFDAGNTMGRIYRIVAKNAKKEKAIRPDLKNATSAELLNLLSHKNQWWRLQAQRLLLHRQDKNIIDSLNQMVAQHSNPQARLHALYILEGMNALDAAIVNTALKDPEPGVRENAVMLAERFPACFDQLVVMAKDSAVRVAFQVALSVGAFKDKGAVASLATSIKTYGSSSWFQTAVLSSEAGSSLELLQALTKDSFFDDATEWKITFSKELSAIIGSRNNKDEVNGLLAFVVQPGIKKSEAVSIALLKGLLEGLKNVKDLNDTAKEKLKSLSADKTATTTALVEGIRQWYSQTADK